MNHSRTMRFNNRFLWPALLACGLGALVSSPACLAPPINTLAKPNKVEIEPATPTVVDSLPWSWADCSGADGKGGTKLSVGPKKTIPLRKDDFPAKLRGDLSTKNKHPKWMAFHSENGKSISLEWTWVTTEQDKFWGNMWAGSGVAFGEPWPTIDINGAKYLVFWAKIGEAGTETELTVRLDCATKIKGSDQTAEVSTSAFAEGRKIGTKWTRVVIPIKEFPDLDKIDTTQLKTVVFSLRGRFPENKPMNIRIDDIYFTDADMVTPVDNLGYVAQGNETVVVWDKDPGQKISKYVVKIDGKETKTVEASQHQIRLPLAKGAHKVSVVAYGDREASTPMSIDVKVDAVQPQAASIQLSDKPAHKISKYFNGTNFAPADQLREARFPINRWGGNSKTKYNWKGDVDSSARDWFYLNGFSKPGAPEEKKSYYLFIKDALEAGADVNFTVPIIPWIAKPATNEKDRLCSFPASKWPKQNKIGSEGCGDGKMPGGQEMIWDNDPNIALVANSPEFEKGLVENIKKFFGGASGKGVKFMSLDNEPGLWHDTHRDAMPKGATTDEIIDLNVKYAKMIRSVDPDVQIIGFTAWGIKELAGSSMDYTPAGPDGFKHFDQAKEGVDRWRDRKAHGDQPQWISYLKGMKKAEQAAGKRLVDIVDIHWYPEIYYKGLRLSENVKAEGTAIDLQFEALREFWDPSFKLSDYGLESWTANDDNRKYMWDAFHPLIPTLKKMIDEAYPGTKLAINEYDTGSRDAYNGALLRANALGIFMQEDVFMAQNWYTMDKNGFTFFAHKMFGNYDGKGGRVEGNFVKSTSSVKDVLSFAAQDGAKTYVVLINKNQKSPFTVAVKLPRPAKTAQTYLLSESLGPRLFATDPKPVSGQDATVTIPAFSAGLVVAQ